MKRSSYLIKPASSMCNMNCSYCFYSDVSNHRKNISNGIMKREIVNSLIVKALSDAQELIFAFQGGEPTLAGLDYFRYFVNKVNEMKKNHVIHYAIQTNGILIDEQWIQFFKENHFLVGLSIDGYRDNHDSVRLKGNNRTYQQLKKTLYLLKKHHIEYNILTVVTKQLSYHADKLYDFYKKNNIHYIQLIPCLPKLNQSTDSFGLTPHDYYRFYHDFFKLWYQDLCRNEYMSVSLFEDLLMIFKGRYPRTCGMLGQCQIQMIVEADGTIYPCDFYALDEYKLGNIMYDSIESILNSPNISLFINKKKQNTSLCDHCRFKNICHGNCHRMNVVYFNDHYCGYQQFLEETYQIFYQIAKNIQ